MLSVARSVIGVPGTSVEAVIANQSEEVPPWN